MDFAQAEGVKGELKEDLEAVSGLAHTLSGRLTDALDHAQSLVANGYDTAGVQDCAGRIIDIQNDMTNLIEKIQAAVGSADDI
jgi:hypothetical protein